jgi:hypothetical protein
VCLPGIVQFIYTKPQLAKCFLFSSADAAQEKEKEKKCCCSASAKKSGAHTVLKINPQSA